jgi:hypothetical protein
MIYLSPSIALSVSLSVSNPQQCDVLSILWNQGPGLDRAD